MANSWNIGIDRYSWCYAIQRDSAALGLEAVDDEDAIGQLH
jgi:hypothetical protein